MRKTLFVCTFLLGALLVPTQSHAQFKNFVNKAKEKAKEVVKETTEEATRQVNPTTTNVVNTVRPPAPWTMQGSPDVDNFLRNIDNQTDSAVTFLRVQMYERYKSNAAVIASGSGDSYDAQMENQNFLRFYYGIRQILNMVISNVQVSANGAIDASNGRYLVTTRKGAGIGYFVGNKDGKFQFLTPKDEGAYLNEEDLELAKEAASRMHKYQIFCYALHEVMNATGEQCDKDLRAMYNLCGICANAIDKACLNNSPANIERKPRPANGAMHASLKADALKVAKADDSDVIDVIITSNVWDVKMKGAIPVNRNVYGFYVVKDKEGTMCLSRAWTQDYIGNGQYGPMRAGGVGTRSPFYIQ